MARMSFEFVSKANQDERRTYTFDMTKPWLGARALDKGHRDGFRFVGTETYFANRGHMSGWS